MSLNAIGMPVSGPASPVARRSSAARARARATSRVFSGQMKAFNSPLSFAMRSRKRPVNSTEEIFLAAKKAESSVRLELSTTPTRLSLYDPGDEIKAPFHRRGDRLVQLAPIKFDDGVRAKTLGRVQGVRHGLDAGRVDPAHLVHQAEHPVQPVEHRLELLGAYGDAGEPGEAPHLVVG